MSKIEWQSIETAPKDGSTVWAYLYDSGIRAVHYVTAEEAAEIEGGSPDEFDPGWEEDSEPLCVWSPKWWLPYDAIPEPPILAKARGEAS